MATLSNLLQRRWQGAGSPTDLLEKGEIFVYGRDKDTQEYCCVCWAAPQSGYVEIEIWGAGGSSATTCCCMLSVPPNPGSYAKKTLFVEKGERIRGCIACANKDVCVPRRDIGFPTVVCVEDRLNATMCAASGQNGSSWCATSTANLVTNITNEMCATRFHSSICGYYCNKFNESYCANDTVSYARASGGDINICGGISCMYVGCCSPEGKCVYVYFMRTPPMRFSTCGTTLVVPISCCNDFYCCQYSGNIEYINMIRLMGRQGYATATCYSSAHIACADSHKYLNPLPPAFPGSPTLHSPSCQNKGFGGGDGQVQIKFLGS